MAGQGFCDGGQHEAVLVGGDGDGVEAVILLEDAEGEEIAWLFDENGVAGAGEEGADQVEGLRGAGGDHELLGLDGGGVAAAEEFGERPAEAAVALRETVVEQLGVAFGEAFGGDLAHEGVGQEREVGLADAEVDAVCAAVDLGGAVVHGGGPPVISDCRLAIHGAHWCSRPLSRGSWPPRIRCSRRAALYVCCR